MSQKEFKSWNRKFDVEGNEDLSQAIQQRIFDLGGEWYPGTNDRKVRTQAQFLFLTNGKLIHGESPADFKRDRKTLSILDDLYEIQKPVRVEVEGEVLFLSKESVEQLKKQLCKK